MFSGLRQLLTQRRESNENGGSSNKGKQKKESQDGQGEGIERSALTQTHQIRTPAVKAVEIKGQDYICSVVFAADGKHVLAGGDEGKIRCWRIEDGREVGRSMDVGHSVYDIAVSRDGRWVVCGTNWGSVKVFDAKSRTLEREWEGHTASVFAVDVSSDGTKIVTGSKDETIRIWSLSTGRQLRKLEHDSYVAAAKFSPNGLLLARAVWLRDSVRVYKMKYGTLLADFRIQVSSWHNKSVAWHHDSRHLFVASLDGYIHHLDAFTGNTLLKLHIHNMDYLECITLASVDTCLAVSIGRFVSLWDLVRHKQLGSLIEYADTVSSLALSSNYDMLVGVGHTITLRDVSSSLPAHYYASRDLHNKLTDLRSRYEEQLHQLRDQRIIALTAELDRRKRSVAIKSDKLATVRRELGRFLDVSHELLSARRDLGIFEARIREMHQHYQVQLTEVTSRVAQYQPELSAVQYHPVTDSDAYAERALIRTLERLNTDIRQASISVSSYLIRRIQSPDAEERSSAAQRVSMSIPKSLVDRLQTMSRHNLSSYLPIASRAYLTSYLYPIISSWAANERTDKLLSDMYGRMRESESRVVAATWRSLTHTNANVAPSASNESGILVSRAIRGLADIAVTADCAASPSDMASKLSPKFWHDVSSMITTAEKLRELVGEALEAGFNVVIVRPAHTFDENAMVVDCDSGPGIPLGRARGKKVLSTTRLGLMKEVVEKSPSPGASTNTPATSAVVKASVVLQENRWG